MTAAPEPAAPRPPAAVPGWLPWLFLGLLVLPFHPYWVDFEQVRRALLLLVAGGTLVVFARLPAVRGERLWWIFVLAAATAGGVHWLADTIGQRPEDARSFQPWEALYRLAHWAALAAVLRLGAAAPRGFGPPLAALLLLTSAFGLLQRLGLGEIAGYGVEREPVSVFGNLNVASEWTAIAAAAVAVLLPRGRLAAAALACAGAYLAANGSRSGLVALPLALLLHAGLLRSAAALRPLGLAAGGALLGWLLAATVARPPAVDLHEQIAAHKRATATLEVRWEIAKASTRLFAESPVFGQGPGQFAVQYPRVRTQQEIEQSSNGRQFATEVRTAHDDWLEVLVEGGLLGFVLFAAALLWLVRGHADRSRLVPLFALMLLMLVRAPLGNAPAVAVALLLVGVPGGPSEDRPTRRWVIRALGALLVLLAVPVLAAHFAFTAYVRAAATGQQPPAEAAAAASEWMPWEPRWLQVASQEHLAAGDLATARTTAARALQLRPFDPQLALLLGEVLARGTAYREAAAIARFALENDPRHPELRVLLSTALLLAGDAEAAVLAVVEDSHPRLRERLPRHFRHLAEQAALRGDEPGAARMRAEQHFLEAIETLGRTGPGELDAASAAVRQLLASMGTAQRLRTDVRPYAVAALHALDLDDKEQAKDWGMRAAKLGVHWPPWQRTFFGDRLQRLAALEPWAPLLR